MAAALFNKLSDPTKARAISAGTEPGTRVHPEVVEVMREIGVDVSRIEPQMLTDEVASRANVLVTVGCGEACPIVPGAERNDWPLDDPKGKPVADVRRIRDEEGYAPSGRERPVEDLTQGQRFSFVEGQGPKGPRAENVKPNRPPTHMHARLRRRGSRWNAAARPAQERGAGP